MSPTQLLAIDTILPTILGSAGLVFLAVALWPLVMPGRYYAARSAAFGIVGVACVALGVWLWLMVVRQAGEVSGQAALTTSPKPATTASASVIAASKPTSASAPPSSSAAAASVAVSPVATVPPTPTVPPNLTPVAAIPFQPENTPVHTAIIGVESFEHGSMLYRDDVKQIYVITLDQKFKVYPDTWKEGQNPDLAAGPINAKFYPGRGFGWLWASDPDVRQTLGLGLTAEAGFTGSISGDGNATTIRADVTYAFNKDGTWALK